MMHMMMHATQVAATVAAVAAVGHSHKGAPRLPAATAAGERSIPPLVRGWSPLPSQGPWCGESCLLANGARLLTANMSLEVDPFMQITDSAWPTVIAEGWWQPEAGGEVAVDAHGRASPAPARFPGGAAVGLARLCAALHGMRGENNAGGLRCGAGIMLGVPRSAVAARSPVLGEPRATAATIADVSDPIGAHHYAINSSALGAAAYAKSLAELLLGWKVDHVTVAGGAMRERDLPAAVAFSAAQNRTATNKRTLAVGRLAGAAGGGVALPLPPAGLWRLADSVAAGPAIWDSWADLAAALRLAERGWRLVAPAPPACGGAAAGGPHCARWDIGPLPIGRLGARRNGNATYPPWRSGSCTPAQLGCGDAAAPPACCPRQSRLSAAESRFVYTLALATNSPLVLGGSLLGRSNSLPSLERFALPDRGAFAYSRGPLTARPVLLPLRLLGGSNSTVMCRGTESATQPRMFDYEWMCFIFNTGQTSRWRDCHSAARPPSTFSRCINRDGEGASAK